MRYGEVTSKLDADVCALLVVQAELACLPVDREHRQTLHKQRDRLFESLADWQFEQLRRVSSSIDDLVAPQDSSQAA